MTILVTGAAGFIGSRLCGELVGEGVDVVGLDCFTDHYDPLIKRRNLATLESDARFSLIEADLRSADLSALVDGAEVVLHLAAIPGVRASWQGGFAAYAEHNIIATQRLLEAVRSSGSRMVYASSSSVYGNASRYPAREGDPLRPSSPYGVSKLSAEQLCMAYAEQFGVHVVTLRYFSVYGPRQRPDMGLNKLINAALSDTSFPVYGDGSQVRDMTFVEDAVDATLLAAQLDVSSGSIINVAGGSEVSIKDLISKVSDLVGHAVQVDHVPPSPGDVLRTGGDTSRAKTLLGWQPRTRLFEGLARQVEWQRMMIQPDSVGGAEP